MAQPDLLLQIQADISQFKVQMAEAAGLLQKVAAEGTTVPPSFRKTEQGFQSLTDRVRGFAAEQRSQGRMAGFFARELEGIIPAAGGASDALRGLTGVMVEGLAGGVGFGMALAAIQAAVMLVRDFNKEADDLADKFTTWRLRAIDAGVASREALLKAQADAAVARFSLTTLDTARRKANEQEVRGLQEIEQATLKVSAARARWQELQAAAAEKGLGKDSADAWKKAREAEEAYNNALAQAGATQQRVLADNRLAADDLNRELAIRRATLDVARAQAALEVGQASDLSAKSLERLKREVEERRLTLELVKATTEAERQTVAIQRAKVEALSEAREAQRELKEQAAQAANASADFWAMEAAAIRETTGGAAVVEAQALAQGRVVEQMKAMKTEAGRIGETLGGALAQVVTGAQTAKEAFRGLMNQAIQMVLQLGLKYAAEKLLEAVLGRTAAVQQVTQSAGKAGAEAGAAVAGIPILGPGLAPAAATETAATILASMMPLAMAQRGFDVPSWLNPITQLHAREMVLPADLADGLRGLIAGGEGRGAVTVQALDAKSFRDALRRRRGALAREMLDLARDRRRA